MKKIKLAFPLSTIGVFFFGITLAAMVFLGLESEDEHNFVDRINNKIEDRKSVV